MQLHTYGALLSSIHRVDAKNSLEEESKEAVPEATDQLNQKTDTVAAAVPVIEVTPVPTTSTQEAAVKPKRLANMVTSWGAGAVKTVSGAGKHKPALPPKQVSSGPSVRVYAGNSPLH